MQIADKLVIEDKKVRVLGFELSVSLAEKIKEYQTDGDTIRVSSANWDGFYAVLEIQDGMLYLVKLMVDDISKDYGELLEVETSERKIICSWFTGSLREFLPNQRYTKYYRDYLFIDGKFVGTETERAFNNKLERNGPKGKR